MVAHSRKPPEYLRRRAAAVFTLPVSPVALLVIVGYPPVVHRDAFGPALGPAEVVIRYPPLDVEGGLDVRLPGSSLLDLLLADVQRLVDGLRPVGEKDGTGIGDERFGKNRIVRQPGGRRSTT